MKYYVMRGEGPYPSVSTRSGPDLPGGPWYHGQMLQIDVPEPLDYILNVQPPYEPEDDEDDDGEVPPSRPKVLINAEAFPVMRADLLEAIRAAGVDNLEVFPAHLHDEVNGVVHRNYFAFNIIGLVAAADLDASELMPHEEGARMLDTDFAALTIDPEKAAGLLMFRLAESCSAIVVREDVKREIESRGIPGVVFYDDGEWSG